MYTFYRDIEYPTELEDHLIAELLFHRIPSVQSRATMAKLKNNMSGISWVLGVRTPPT